MLDGEIKVGDRLVWFDTDATRRRLRFWVTTIVCESWGRGRYDIAWPAGDGLINHGVLDETLIRAHCIRDPLPHGTDAECFAAIDREQEKQRLRAKYGEGFADCVKDGGSPTPQERELIENAVADRMLMTPEERQAEKAQLEALRRGHDRSFTGCCPK